MLFAVVEPVASATGANDALQLVGLHPDELVAALVVPLLEALSSQFHRSSGHPFFECNDLN